MKISNWAIAVRNLLAIVVMITIFTAGCGKPTPAKIAGTYVRTDGPLVETIVLNTNGTFDQTVAYSDGQLLKVSSRWTNDHRQVQFTRLYVTRDVESSKVLSPAELRYGVNFMWEQGVLARNPKQGYLLRLKQQSPP